MRKYNVKTELVTDGEVITPIEDEPSCSKKGRRKTQNTTSYSVEAAGATSLVDLDRHSHIEFEQDADKVRLM